MVKTEPIDPFAMQDIKERLTRAYRKTRLWALGYEVIFEEDEEEISIDKVIKFLVEEEKDT